MTPFLRFLCGRLDDLRPLLRRRIEMRVALHRHPGASGVVEAAETILRAVPGGRAGRARTARRRIAERQSLGAAGLQT